MEKLTCMLKSYKHVYEINKAPWYLYPISNPNSIKRREVSINCKIMNRHIPFRSVLLYWFGARSLQVFVFNWKLKYLVMYACFQSNVYHTDDKFLWIYLLETWFLPLKLVLLSPERKRKHYIYINLNIEEYSTLAA